MPSVTGLLAHQGGWDEILMLVAPVGVIVGILALVKRRVDRGTTVHEHDPAERR